MINAADSEQSRSPDKRRLATQHGSCMGRLYVRMNEYLECICVLWPSGRCQGWKGGHDTNKKKRTHSEPFSSRIAVKEQRWGTRSLLDVHTTRALRCTEMNHLAWVLGVHVAVYRTGDYASCRLSGRAPSGSMTAGRGCLLGLRRHAGGAGRQWTPRAVEQIRNACTRCL